jgi:hypothetical protein
MMTGFPLRKQQSFVFVRRYRKRIFARKVLAKKAMKADEIATLSR